MRKLAIFAAGFAIAAALFVYLSLGALAFWIAGGALMAAAAVCIFRLKRVSILLLGLAVGLLWAMCYQTIWMSDLSLLDQTEQSVTARVVQMPYETGKGAAVQCRFGKYQAIVYGNEGLLQARPGDTVSCTAQIVLEKDDLSRRSDGVVLCMFAQDQATLTVGTANGVEKIRMWLWQRIDTLYDAEAEGLIRALLIGDRSGLRYSTNNNLALSGLSHAVAVSGMHVSILLTMISMLCGYQRRLTAILGTPLVVFFVLLTGASASVCRAAVMNVILLWSGFVRREHDDPTALGMAALLLLLQNPWCIASVSFQLSFAAVAGLMLFSPHIRERILAVKKKPGKVLEFVAAGVSATLGAMLTTLPLTVVYFEMVSIVAPVMNLLLLWAVTAVFTLSLSSCVLGGAGVVLAWPVTLLCELILESCRLAASVPYCAAYLENIPLMIWAVIGYFLFALLLLVERLPVRWILCGVTAGFLACVLCARVFFFQRPWEMTVLDVGQGQCIILRIEDHITVIDCGGSDPEEAGEKAARYLQSAGVMKADALILTHYDEDHAGGAEQFLRRIPTQLIYLPPADAQPVLSQLEPWKDKICYVTTVVDLAYGEGNIRIFPPVSQENENNAGVSVLASASECDILITGDLDSKTESFLITTYDLPDIELLLAGHHGAETSTSDALLVTLTPEVAAISVGADNYYGHPHPRTMDRLQRRGVQSYRTDLLGDLHFIPERR